MQHAGEVERLGEVAALTLTFVVRHPILLVALKGDTDDLFLERAQPEPLGFIARRLAVEASEEVLRLRLSLSKHSTHTHTER